MVRSSPSRRSLLRAAATASAVGLSAGCSGLSGEAENHHSVTVINSRSSNKTFRVTISNAGGDRLADEVVELGPDRVGDFTFEGTAARVEVQVDGDPLREFPWSPMSKEFYARYHPNGCQNQATSLTLGLIDRLHVQYGCETVRQE